MYSRDAHDLEGFLRALNFRELTYDAGFTGDTRISISWLAPFFDDGVTDVIGYRIEYSSDGGNTWTQHSAQSEQDPLTKSYAMTCLLNDQPYLLRVGAINLYGLGSWKQIGASSSVSALRKTRTPRACSERLALMPSALRYACMHTR
jgi:hypothetical protein